MVRVSLYAGLRCRCGKLKSCWHAESVGNGHKPSRRGLFSYVQLELCRGVCPLPVQRTCLRVEKCSGETCPIFPTQYNSTVPEVDREIYVDQMSSDFWTHSQGGGEGGGRPQTRVESSDNACCSVVNSFNRNFSLSKRVINISERIFSSTNLILVKFVGSFLHTTAELRPWTPMGSSVPIKSLLTNLNTLTTSMCNMAQYLSVKPDDFYRATLCVARS